MSTGHAPPPALFACSACGKKFKWKPEIAGKPGKCVCGARLVAPLSMPVPAGQVRPPVRSAGIAQAEVGKGQPIARAQPTAKAPPIAPVQPIAPTPPIAHTSQAPPVSISILPPDVLEEAAEHPEAVPAIPVAAPPGVKPVEEAQIGALSKQLEEDEGLYDLVEEARPAAAPALKGMAVGTGGLCPACGATLPARAVLCVGCGFDLRSGTKLNLDGSIPGAQAGATMAAVAAARTGIPVPAAMAFPTKPAFKPVEEDLSPVMPNRAWEVVLSAALIVLGGYLTLLVAMKYGKQPVPFADALPGVGLTILANLGLMVVAIVIAAYTIEDAFMDPIWKIVLKTCAIGLVPVPVGQILGAHIGDINGDMARVFSSIGLYVLLFIVLFRLNLLHTAACVLVIWVIRTGVDYVLYKAEGMKKNSWI